MREPILVLATLVFVAVSAIQSRSEADSSPKDVVAALWKDAADGRLLTLSGWKSSARFFVHADPFRGTDLFLVVADDWSVGPVIVKETKAEVDVNYIAAGRVDASLRYTSPPRNPHMKTAIAYHLVRVPQSDTPGGQVWRIEDPRGSPWTTVSTAILRVKDLREKSSDPTIKKNADATLAQLAKLR